MEQSDLNNKIVKNENDISEIKGKWDALATKEFVRDAINEQTRQLTKEINGIRDRQTRTIGIAVGIGFVLSLAIGAGNLAVQLGWIQTVPK